MKLKFYKLALIEAMKGKTMVAKAIANKEMEPNKQGAKPTHTGNHSGTGKAKGKKSKQSVKKLVNTFHGACCLHRTKTVTVIKLAVIGINIVRKYNKSVRISTFS